MNVPCIHGKTGFCRSCWAKTKFTQNSDVLNARRVELEALNKRCQYSECGKQIPLPTKTLDQNTVNRYKSRKYCCLSCKTSATNVRLKGRGEERSEEYRAKHRGKKPKTSAGLKRYWSSLTQEERTARSGSFARGALGKKISSINKLIHTGLTSCGLVALLEHPLPGGYAADVYLPDFNLDVECDGTYWHDETYFPNVRKREQRRDQYLKRKGISILRLSEDKINSNLAGCLQAIKDLILPKAEPQCPRVSTA